MPRGRRTRDLRHGRDGRGDLQGVRNPDDGAGGRRGGCPAHVARGRVSGGGGGGPREPPPRRGSPTAGRGGGAPAPVVFWGALPPSPTPPPPPSWPSGGRRP